MKYLTNKLTRKDLMIKNLKRFKKQLEKEGKTEEASEYNYFPVTYNLPNDYSIFVEEFKKNTNSNNNLWIMKPISKSQGKGIFLFSKIQHISNWKSKYNPDSSQAEPYVVQKYIHEPLLIGGKKFDLRVYVLVTSYQPLVVYVYRSGFGRFTHQRYDIDDISNSQVHLTNVAVQKYSENYDNKIGGKWPLDALKLYLIGKYGQEKVKECFCNIQSIFIKSLLAVQKLIIQDKHCFELYGFDILLDAQLKPWLLEVNASPSMTSNTKSDYLMKTGLLDDTFAIVDMEKLLLGTEEQVGGFDLVYKNGLVMKGFSHLGSYNNRIQNLKKLSKAAAIRLAQQYQEQQAKQEQQQQKMQIGTQKIEKSQGIDEINKQFKKTPNNVPQINQQKQQLKKKQKAQEVQSNLTIQQTTAFTQSVIKNINSMAGIQQNEIINANLQQNQQQKQIKKKKKRTKISNQQDANEKSLQNVDNENKNDE